MLTELPSLVGRRPGPTVDPERAEDSPFGHTIAHGYVSVAMLAPSSQQLLEVGDANTSVNDGMDRLRFPAALVADCLFRYYA